MKLDYRQHGQGGLCPRPEVHVEDRFLLLIVPWGEMGGKTGGEAAQEVLSMVRDSFLAARSDPDKTQPFAVLDCLSLQANQLLTAVQTANTYVYKNFNTEKYNFGFEVVAMAKNQNQWVMASSGGAGVFVLPSTKKKECDLQTVSYGQALRPVGDQVASPVYLPQNIIGLHATCHLQVYNFQDFDNLLITWHPQLPPAFLQLPQSANTPDLDAWHHHLARLDPEAHFWLGRVQKT